MNMLKIKVVIIGIMKIALSHVHIILHKSNRTLSCILISLKTWLHLTVGTYWVLTVKFYSQWSIQYHSIVYEL